MHLCLSSTSIERLHTMFGNLFVCRLNSGHLGLTTTRHYYYMLNTLQSIHIFKCMVFCTQRFSCSIPPLFYIYPIPLQQNSYGFPFIYLILFQPQNRQPPPIKRTSLLPWFSSPPLQFAFTLPPPTPHAQRMLISHGTVSIVTDIIFSVYVLTSLLWSIHKYFISAC